MRRATVGDVEVLLEENWQAGGYNVFVLERRGVAGERQQLRYVDDPNEFALRWEQLKDDGRTPAPTMFLPADALEALIAAAAGVTPAVPAHVEALEDARDVRDRLLTLVENERAAQSVSGHAAAKALADIVSGHLGKVVGT